MSENQGGRNFRKAHSRQRADELMRDGWKLIKELRAKPGDEPYEYLFEWTKSGAPPRSGGETANDETQKLYCKVFADTDMSEKQLVFLVWQISSGRPGALRTVSTPNYEADIIENDEFNPYKRSKGDDQFLFYRYYLDVVPTPDASRQDYVKAVSNLLDGLWRGGCKAVAACSFEDELPRNGGYKRQGE